MPRRLAENRKRGFQAKTRFAPRNPAPLNKGEQYEVTIQALSRRGQGIARVKGFVVFVPDTNVGQRVTIRIAAIGPHSAQAVIVA